MSDKGEVLKGEVRASASLIEQPFGARGLLILGILLLINILNFVDRQLPFILVDSIRADLKLTDSQIGLMAGVTFALVYSFAALPLARLADRRSPRLVLSATLTIWSVMTAMGGLAQNFSHLLLARIGVAAGEAGSTPAAHALIARVFPSEKRSSMLALFSLGVPIGSMFGLVLGGWINDLTNWRSAFFIVGLPGLMVAIVGWFVLPAVPGHQPAETAQGSFRGTMAYLFRLRSFRHMVAASSLFSCGSYAMNVFAPAFLIRTHQLSTAKAGLGLGLAFGVGGLIGTFAGGALADRLGRKDARWRQLVPALGQLLSAPVALAAWLVPNPLVSVVLLIFVYLLGLLYFAPTFAAAQSLVPDQMRATASAVLLFFLTLIGSSVGPLVIGWVSDFLAPDFGALSLRYAMCLLAITMVLSAWQFLLAARALPGDLAATSATLVPSGRD